MLLNIFFSQLRGKGGFNYMPTSYDIGHHFANILVSKILQQSSYANCILEDSDSIEFDWDIFKQEYRASIKGNGINDDNPGEEIDSAIQNLDLSLENNAVTYYAGYCLLKKIKCELCQVKLFKGNEEICHNETFTHEKNYKKDVSTFGSLRAPSNEFVLISKLIFKIFESKYLLECHLPNIREKIALKSFNNISQIYPTFLPDKNDPCYKHIEELINFFILVLIRKNCKWSVLSHEFDSKKGKHKTNHPSTSASKKLKILNN